MLPIRFSCPALLAARTATVLAGLAFGSCAVLDESSRSVLGDVSPALDPSRSQLSQLNELVAGRADWFDGAGAAREAMGERYDGELPPTLAAYLERDIYVYDDARLEAYLTALVDRLLEAWSGPSPSIDVVIQSDSRFAAHVDALDQLRVSTGLLRELDSEDQLAAVLAHEIAHVLLRHAESKAGRERLGESVGSLRDTTVSLMGDARLATDATRAFALDASVANDSAGLLWSDLLVPAWSRGQEHEADRLGLDLMIGAGYNHTEFAAVLSKIHDAAASRSRRLELIETLANAKLERERSRTSERIGDENGETLGRLVGNLLDSRLDALARRTKSHADGDVRVTLLQRYLIEAHGDDDLPPPSTYDAFREAIGRDAEKPVLARDLAAVETIIALADENVRAARSAFERVADGDSVHVAARIARSSLDVAARRYDEAAARLAILIKNPRAPVEAYLRLSRLQAYLGDVPAALATLDVGERRIGRAYRFLPTRIYVQKTAGMAEAAARSTVACADYDAGVTRARVERLAGVDTAGENAYYVHCADILGADPLALEAEARRDRALDVVDSACGLLGKLAGGDIC